MANIIGKILLDQYRVDTFIASGGMGSVYRIWDIKRNVQLAMKTLNADLAEDEHVFKLFEREARALKKLTHPNIVSFYGLFQIPEFAFLLEQYVDGPSLKDILKENRGQPFDKTQTMIYLKAVASALGYAHANGVVHCDVKPGNVLVDRGGSIYLTDFGIARHADSTTTTLGTMGTAAYMAPEQIRGEAVSSATDVYALGILLFEMLTGQRPFKGNEFQGDESGATANERIRAAHLRVPAPDAHSINPNISIELAAVIQKAMSKSRESRYQSANDLLLAACSALGLEVNAIPLRVTPPVALYERTINEQSRPKPAPILWMGLLFVALVIGSIFFIFRATQTSSPTVLSPTQTPQVVVVVITDIPSLPDPTEIPTDIVFPTDSPNQAKPTTKPKPTKLYCDGAPHQVRFKVNQAIRVCTKKDALALRDKANGTTYKWLLPTSDLTIVGGPQCKASVIWWKVKTESGYLGWVMDGADTRDTNFICATP